MDATKRWGRCLDALSSTRQLLALHEREFGALDPHSHQRILAEAQLPELRSRLRRDRRVCRLGLLEAAG
jgi:hypothetical protein